MELPMVPFIELFIEFPMEAPMLLFMEPPILVPMALFIEFPMEAPIELFMDPPIFIGLFIVEFIEAPIELPM